MLKKIYMEQSQERIFDLFPAGGVSGTLTNWYGGINEPYLYAKSGSLGNVYCLSGYLRTKSGKTLIFSIMNNHYKQPTEEIKKRMQLVFENLRDHY
ncbi:D-alanyl-D-alanine carboxypeptidase [Cellulophaga baltica 4]|nr:D-alanyl-D-alanine carboxypeptidase [Cellulophaga baltica 4]